MSAKVIPLRPEEYPTKALELVRDSCSDHISFVRDGVERFIITGAEYREIIEAQKRIDAKLGH